MKCENDPKHDPDNYCESCSTCHDCLEEERDAMSERLNEARSIMKEILNVYYYEASAEWPVMYKAEKWIEKA